MLLIPAEMCKYKSTTLLKLLQFHQFLHLNGKKYFAMY